MPNKPDIAVVIATKGRNAKLGGTLDALLNRQISATAPYSVYVVDQTPDHSVAEFIDAAGFAGHPRFRYIQTPRMSGVSAGRNVGAEAALASGSEVVLFTDSDCYPQDDWIWATARVFNRHPDTALVHGTVLPYEAERPGGLTPQFRPERSSAYNPLEAGWRGIGANMAVSGSLLARIRAKANGQPFDELMGTGAPRIQAAEDIDFTIRAAVFAREDGSRIRVAADSVIVHDGRREGIAARRLIYDSYTGIGAVCEKHARAGHHELRGVFTRQLINCLGIITRDSALAMKPTGAARLLGLIRGFRLSRAYQIEREPLLYANRSERTCPS